MNRLANETSPYLLQHAHNPVDWYPWSEEAFAKARAGDRPVFLSIGYSACHWCHVMERESFEDPEVAAILNEHFVSIKVDREERPDVDSIYMQAVQMMTGHGGWPMSMFLTPDGRPFYAGTYFPPEPRHGMPSFRQVLLQLAEAYRTRRGDVETAGNEIRAALSAAPQSERGSVDRAALDRAASRVVQGYDRVNGGFGGAPKFPPSMTLDFLMQVAWRDHAGEGAGATLRDVIIHTLRKMAEGGMYDQVGGGFHRYSTDAEWLVPHFEKMLYDNALLARLYTRAWQWTHDPFFARIANEILGFVAREMTSPDGAFYSTLDADSEGVEGKFYVWSRAEVMSIVGDEDGKIFCELFDVTERGNWEGTNILHVVGDVDAHRELVLRAKCKLYGVRAERVWPGRDEKVLAGWNGWMLAAFAEACIAFDRYADVVKKNADFLLTRIDASGRLVRHAKINGLLEDYSGVAWGLALAYEAVNDQRYLDAARTLADQILERFADEANGGFFDTPVDHEQLITRPKDLFDNATPGGNSVAAAVFLRVGCGSQPHQGPAESRPLHKYAEAAKQTVESILPLAERYPSGFGFLLGVAEWLAGSPKEIHLMGGDVSTFRKVVGETYLPHRTIAYGESETPSAFVCENFVCLKPTDDPEQLREQLQ